MTLVFRTEHGALQQTQVEPADVAAIISGTQSIWGWVGGLSIVRSILDNVRGTFSEETARRLAAQIPIRPAVCHILTRHGSTLLSGDNGQPPFGGDFRTQLVGLSICALARECGGLQAINLFMDHLAPSLFKANEATEALYVQLKDNRAKILNEEAARGLTPAFAAAIARLNLPSWNGYQGSSEPGARDGYIFTDTNYVIGFWRRLVQKKRDTYFTRTSVVARVAACLKEVGYFIGQIQVWEREGPRRLIY